MELTLEAYRNIVKNVGSRADIAALCGVSRGFRYVAERALYNTLFMQNDEETGILCQTLATTPRLAMLVDALTIYLAEKSEDDSEDEEDDEDEEEEPTDPREMDWSAVAGALKQTKYLRYLNVHINDGSSSSVSWVLSDTTFQLRRFHCDFDWDSDLVTFLNRQTRLEDLYLNDFKDSEDPKNPAPSRSLQLAQGSVSSLSTLECTFSEAAMAIVPGRPVTHLKTCFSHSETNAKRKEMDDLLAKTALSTEPLRSLDLADSSYDDRFSRELLIALVKIRPLMTELRHLGIFVLPVDGRERLRFYGLLRRLPKLQSVEFEVSSWRPSPSSPPALRALAGELRLYNPSVIRMIFVHDFDRSVVTAVNGICRVDTETSAELLWREK
ncbi:hypothetical protein CPC08DRAFT_637480 [Agrocybe pediades]|nr:hypothetical protein CPC08DRAFT_637480 [Agrocybe pediades]